MRILAGNPPNPPFFMSPLYPYFISLIYKIFGPSLAPVLTIQGVIESLNIFLVYQIARRISTRRIGILAATIYAIFPQPIFYSGLLLMPILLTGLVLTGINTLIQSRNGLLPGLIFGIASLGRGNILLPALFSSLFIKRRFYLIGLFIPILFLFIINLTLGKSPIPTTYNLGLNFYIGNSPWADGTYQRPGGLDLTRDPDGRKALTSLLKRPVSPSESSKEWFKLGFTFINKHPLRSIVLTVKKCYLFFGPVELFQFENLYYVMDQTWLKYLPIRLWMLIPLFLISLLAKTGKVERLLKGFVLIYGLSFLPFFIIGRFRQPVLPIIVILAGVTIPEVLKRKNLKLLGAILVIGYGILNLLSQSRIRESVTTSCADYGLWAYYNHRPYILRDTCLLILRRSPDNVRALVNLGNYYFRGGRYNQALSYYQRAVSIDPEDGEANFNLGIDFLVLGQADSALLYLKRASLLLPYNYEIPSYLERLKNLKSGD